MLVQAKSRELTSDSEALEVRVSAQMHVAAEHSGADECDFDCAFHDWFEPLGKF
jgi:hypothetical protein